MTVRKSIAERLGLSHRHQIGLSPGTVVFTGARRVEKVTASLITFTPEEVRAVDGVDPADIRPPTPDDDGVQWVNVIGLHDTDLIQALGQKFDLHPLLLEDIVSVRGRPSYIEYENHAAISLKALSWSEQDSVEAEHITLVLGEDYVLSFQERPGDAFRHVRERILAGKARIRKRGADYLWYALLDAIVDEYLITVEQLATRIDEAEERVWDGDGTEDMPRVVQRLRAGALEIRRAQRPLREEVDKVIKECPEWFSDDMGPFLTDLQVHLLQLGDAVDSMRDSLTSVMDAHLTILQARANEVMKVLTIMASIFIPLTFLVGVYGMNFEYMPELGKPWAYPLVWTVMILMGVGMLTYFRRKKWL